MITLKRDNVIKVVDSAEKSEKLQKEGFLVILDDDKVINSEEEATVTEEDSEGSIDENEEAGEGKKHGRGNKKDSK